MPTRRLSQTISNLSLEEKLIAAGGLITAVSVFLPWYQDLDAFKTGDMFLGITGPLYLIGLIILAIGVVSVLSILSTTWQHKIAKTGLDLSVSHIVLSAFGLFLLVLTNSVYYHPKFGVNIVLKEFRFGMVMAFIGIGLLLIGGIFEYRKGGIKWDKVEGKAEPLIDMERHAGGIHQEPKSLDEATKFEDEIKHNY